jgi:hypothetical protein
VPVLLLIVAAAILGGVVAAALGRAGELGRAPADCAPVDLGIPSPAEVALLRPPMSLWGYNMQVTDDALQAIARALTVRDVEIATLRSQLAERDGPAGWTPPASATPAPPPRDSGPTTPATPPPAPPAGYSPPAAPTMHPAPPAEPAPATLPAPTMHPAPTAEPTPSVHPSLAVHPPPAAGMAPTP